MLKEYVAVSSASSQTPVEFVASFWDQRWRDLRDNRRLLRLRQREEYRFLKKVVRDFSNRPLDILDCGCGQGEWTLLFQLEGHRAVGIDIAGETIRQLSAKHGEAFRFGDFRNIESADNSYDVVINWGGIEHFEEGPAQAILAAKRVLRPGGLFIATTPCHNARLFLRDALFGRGLGLRTRWKGIGSISTGSVEPNLRVIFWLAGFPGFVRASFMGRRGLIGASIMNCAG